MYGKVILVLALIAVVAFPLGKGLNNHYKKCILSVSLSLPDNSSILEMLDMCGRAFVQESFKCGM